MKKYLLIFSIIIIFLSASSKAQITLEFTFDSTTVGNFYCTDLGSNDYKYVFLNLTSNSFSLFNLDMTPYLTNVQIPTNADSIVNGFGVIYITKELFDCDATNIEYVYQNPYSVNHSFRIFRTDGTLLMQVDSANGPFQYGGIYGGAHEVHPIFNTSSGAKLLLQKYDLNNVPQVLVYSLCGTLPTNYFDFSNYNSYVNVFPNPSSLELRFNISLPNNQEEFELVIIDNNSYEQRREKIYSRESQLLLNLGDLSSGLYYFSLVSKDKIYQTGKFVLTK